MAPLSEELESFLAAPSPAAKPGVILQLRADALRTWDLRAILPD